MSRIGKMTGPDLIAELDLLSYVLEGVLNVKNVPGATVSHIMKNSKEMREAIEKLKSDDIQFPRCEKWMEGRKDMLTEYLESQKYEKDKRKHNR